MALYDAKSNKTKQDITKILATRLQQKCINHARYGRVIVIFFFIPSNYLQFITRALFIPFAELFQSIILQYYSAGTCQKCNIKTKPHCVTLRINCSIHVFECGSETIPCILQQHPFGLL